MGLTTSDELEKVALAQGGNRSFKFSQGKDLLVAGLDSSAGPRSKKVYKDFTTPGGRAMGGVCATICAFWAIFDKNQENESFKGGISIWDYILANGPGGECNPTAAYEIATEHALSYGNQMVHLTNFMSDFGVEERTTSTSGVPMTNTFQAIVDDSAIAATRLMEHIQSGGGGYKLISMKKNLAGTGGGHMIAVHWDWGIWRFMDPNYGEYVLPTDVAFRNFVSQYFREAYQEGGSCKYKSLKPYHFA